jgi:hypothetical protein
MDLPIAWRFLTYLRVISSVASALATHLVALASLPRTSRLSAVHRPEPGSEKPQLYDAFSGGQARS